MEALLRKIGLTEGEIKTYKTLLKLKKSSTGLIIKESSISASKVYIILDRLIEKGLVSFIVENNVKKFSPTNPENILEYIEKQQKELEDTKKESQDLIKQISKTIGDYKEESAQIYKGQAGLRVALDNVLLDLGKDGEYLFFSVSNEEYTEKTQKQFDKNHEMRINRKINAKGIMDISLKPHSKTFKKRKLYEFKFYKLTLPTSIAIGKTRIVLAIFGDEPIAFEIISERITKKYKDYFYKLWNTIQ